MAALGLLVYLFLFLILVAVVVGAISMIVNAKKRPATASSLEERIRELEEENRELRARLKD
ncbi:hypothetical protein [Planococcus lenghuensis]|uniref:DUF4083 domain-containing protein n=1 Tax=Planococcus lenghuensis TaxID=2213202 RepID=A0A1Q2KY26_9BACL|nr:hypothetical protein [Planococcus lenghuensis]AQQ53118.1 hypothetical protein B0X71_08430 [Planococcus lenghuensis]